MSTPTLPFTIATATLLFAAGGARRGEPGCLETYASPEVRRGNFSSPGYPAAYPEDVNCRFQFRAGEGEVVWIRWAAFHLEGVHSKTQQCLRDYVEVIVTDTQNQQHVSGRFCGDQNPPEFKTMQRSVDIIFQSSFTKHYQGFSGTFHFLPEKDVEPPASVYPGGKDAHQHGCGGFAPGTHGGVRSLSPPQKDVEPPASVYPGGKDAHQHGCGGFAPGTHGGVRSLSPPQKDVEPPASVYPGGKDAHQHGCGGFAPGTHGGVRSLSHPQKDVEPPASVYPGGKDAHQHGCGGFAPGTHGGVRSLSPPQKDVEPPASVYPGGKDAHQHGCGGFAPGTHGGVRSLSPPQKDVEPPASVYPGGKDAHQHGCGGFAPGTHGGVRSLSPPQKDVEPPASVYPVGKDAHKHGCGGFAPGTHGGVRSLSPPQKDVEPPASVYPVGKDAHKHGCGGFAPGTHGGVRSLSPPQKDVEPPASVYPGGKDAHQHGCGGFAPGTHGGVRSLSPPQKDVEPPASVYPVGKDAHKHGCGGFAPGTHGGVRSLSPPQKDVEPPASVYPVGKDAHKHGCGGFAPGTHGGVRSLSPPQKDVEPPASVYPVGKDAHKHGCGGFAPGTHGGVRSLSPPQKDVEPPASVYPGGKDAHQHGCGGFAPGTHGGVRSLSPPQKDVEPPASVYPGGKDAHQHGCGGFAPGTHGGVITNPGYPETYPGAVDCYWVIRVEPGKQIYIKLVELELAESLAECRHARIQVLDGYSPIDLATEPQLNIDNLVASQQLVQFCGQSEYYKEEGEKSYTSDRNRIIVRFKTSGPPYKKTEEKRAKYGKPIGFRLVWTEVEGVDVLNGPSNSLEDCSEFMCAGGEFCVAKKTVCAERQRYCIHKSLVCDGVSHCVESDDSDEQNCYSYEIVGAGTGVFVALVSIILLVICCQRRRNIKELREMEERVETADGGMWGSDLPNGRNRGPSHPDKNHNHAQPIKAMPSNYHGYGAETAETAPFLASAQPSTANHAPPPHLPLPPKQYQSTPQEEVADADVVATLVHVNRHPSASEKRREFQSLRASTAAAALGPTSSASSSFSADQPGPVVWESQDSAVPAPQRRLPNPGPISSSGKLKPKPPPKRSTRSVDTGETFPLKPILKGAEPGVTVRPILRERRTAAPPLRTIPIPPSPPDTHRKSVGFASPNPTHSSDSNPSLPPSSHAPGNAVLDERSPSPWHHRTRPTQV